MKISDLSQNHHVSEKNSIFFKFLILKLKIMHFSVQPPIYDHLYSSIISQSKLHIFTATITFRLSKFCLNYFAFFPKMSVLCGGTRRIAAGLEKEGRGEEDNRKRLVLPAHNSPMEAEASSFLGSIHNGIVKNSAEERNEHQEAKQC